MAINVTLLDNCMRYQAKNEIYLDPNNVLTKTISVHFEIQILPNHAPKLIFGS